MKSSNLLDMWIEARMGQFADEMITACDTFQTDTGARLIIPLVDDLSNWYVRRSRQRFQAGAEDGEMSEAFNALYGVLMRLANLIAPYMPFISEEIFRNLSDGRSVHLEVISEAKKLTGSQSKLLEEMAKVREVVSEGLAMRAKEGIKVRQPLAKLTVFMEKLDDELVEIMKDEVNVKVVEFKAGSETELVELDINLTDELKREGVAREIIRHGQMLRREAGYALDDRIKLVVETEDAGLDRSFQEHKETILQALQVDEVVSGGDEDTAKDLSVDGNKLHLGVLK